MGENEKRAMADAPEDYIDRALWHIDSGDLLGRRVVDEDLSVRNIHIAISIDRDTLAAALSKRTQVAERSVCAN